MNSIFFSHVVNVYYDNNKWRINQYVEFVFIVLKIFALRIWKLFEKTNSP
jgi:hypothetical protein